MKIARPKTERSTVLSRKRVIEIVEEIYTELYASAQPPLNYRELLEAPDAVKKVFDYSNHYLSQERFDAIVQKHLKKSRLSEHWKKSIRASVYLGHGPTSVTKGEKLVVENLATT